jgi:hypothetical protein
MAEAAGFEPAEPHEARSLSKRLHSSALPRFLVFCFAPDPSGWARPLAPILQSTSWPL